MFTSKSRDEFMKVPITKTLTMEELSAALRSVGLQMHSCEMVYHARDYGMIRIEAVEDHYLRNTEPKVEEQQPMKDANLFAALNKNVIAVEVELQKDGKLYTYKALREWNIKEGDSLLVVVTSNNVPETKVVTAKVVHPDAACLGDIKYKWIIQKIDTAAYHDIIEKEKNFEQALLTIERDRKRDELRDELVKRLGTNASAQLASATGVELLPGVAPPPSDP